MKKFFITILLIISFCFTTIKSVDAWVIEPHEMVLAEDNNNEDDNDGIIFAGLLLVAFVAISVFLIAYKSDDGYDD